MPDFNFVASAWASHVLAWFADGKRTVGEAKALARTWHPELRDYFPDRPDEDHFVLRVVRFNLRTLALVDCDDDFAPKGE